MILTFMSRTLERLSGEVTERCVRRGSPTAVSSLQKAMLGYLDERNKDPRPFVRTRSDPREGSATS